MDAPIFYRCPHTPCGSSGKRSARGCVGNTVYQAVRQWWIHQMARKVASDDNSSSSGSSIDSIHEATSGLVQAIRLHRCTPDFLLDLFSPDGLLLHLEALHGTV